MQQISRLLLTFVLNAAWQVTLVAAAAWLCSRLIRHAPARFVHRLWVAALALGLLLPICSAVKVCTAAGPAAARATVHRAFPVQSGSSILSFLRIPESVSVTPFWIDVCAALYLVLLLWRALRMVRSWLATERLRTTARPSDPSPQVARLAARSCAAFGISTVSLCSSSLARSPLTVGISSHKIVVPDAVWTMASDDEWASILSHEMAHIQRGDLIKNLLYEVLCWPVFFHPASALMKRQIGRTRELACDEMATERFVGRTIYARALINLAGMASGLPRPLPSNYSLGVTDSSILEERVMKLLHHYRSLCPQPGKLLALALSMLVALSLAVAAFAVAVKPGNASLQDNKDKVTLPSAISAPEPEYPDAEKKANNSGDVTLAIVVGPDGNVHDWRVLSSTAEDFADQSIAAVRQWTFHPAQKDGKPVSAEIHVRFEFKLYPDKPKAD